MNDRQLHYILTIAKEKNMTTAAQKLYISQPSLSSMLSNVEKQLGVKLFDRSVTPMALTYAGEQFIETAEQIVNSYSDLKRKIDDINNTMVGRLSIGCGPHSSHMLIPKILPPFMSRYPGIQINLYEESRGSLEKKLISADLDIIITTIGNAKNANIEYIPLYQEELMLITHASADMTLCTEPGEEGKRYINLKEVKDKPFVLMKSGHQLRISIDHIFQDNGYEPNIILETDSWETCLLLTEVGSAYTILPKPKINIMDNRCIKMFSTRPQYYREVFLCYRKGAYRSKIINEFIDMTLSFWQDRN